MTFFSIIIPTYNQGNLLSECLNSLQLQTFQNWEAIIIDNYSIDNTQNIIDNYKDERIKSFKFRNNGIIAASRNYGIKRSKGEYICFLDSDDYWFANKLEVINKLIPEGYNFISNGEIWIKNKNKKCQKTYQNSNEKLYRRLLFIGNNLSTSAITIERKLLLKNKCFSTQEAINGIEDYDLWLRIAKDENKKYYSIKQTLGVFRIHQEGNSKKLKRQLKSEINVLKSHFSKLRHQNVFINIVFFLRIIKTFIRYSIFELF